MKKLLQALAMASMAFALTACVPSDFYTVYQPQQYAPAPAVPSYTAPAYYGLPKNYREFRDRCQMACQTPEGAAKMYFDAVFCYMDKNKRAEASKMLRYILHTHANWERSNNYSTFVSRLKDSKYHHIFRSFAEDTSPENDYSMSPERYRLMIGECVEEQGYLRLFLYSSGADSARPIWVKQFDDGLWYVINNVSTYAGVRDPYSVKNDNSHDASYDRYRR